MAPTVKWAEQEAGGKVKYFLSDGTNWECTEKDLITYIEDSRLNVDVQFSHNTKGGSDPRFDEFREVFKDPETILDESWDQICEDYYRYKFRLNKPKYETR